MEEIRAEIKSLQDGKYTVLSILGAGGFGITYRCVDNDTGAVCAVKEYMPEAIASRDPRRGEIIPQSEKRKAYLHGKKRFLEEADILMKMNSIPSVVHVWESFEENNTAYYVMEFLEGTTLKQLMRAMGGKLPYSVACEAVEKAGTALDMVHRQAGIFHRDISPENIMVMPDGSVKIIDFGSAKSMSVSENQQFSVVLKPGFAPPEQYASNLSQGSFTDVYAMAGTFYYAASGKMIPVAPDRLMGVAYESLDKLVAECSHETAVAVDRALNLDAKFRTQTMSEFIQSISREHRRISQTVRNGDTQADLRETESGTGPQPGTAGKAGTVPQPGAAGKAGTGLQPGTAGKTGTMPQPGTAGKTGTRPQPGTAGKTGTGPQPGTAWKTGTMSQPGAAWKTGTGPQPGTAGKIGEADGGVRRTEQKEAMSVFSQVKTETVEPLPREALEEPPAWLTVVRGACAGKRFPLWANQPVTVGRSSKKSQIVLDGHPEISGLHFRLLFAPQKSGFYVIDESINGLYYQGIRLEKGKKYKVLPGDQLGVGSMQCMITVGVKGND